MTSFRGDRAALEARAERLKATSDEDLRRRYRAGKRERRLYLRADDVDLRAAVGLWEMTGEASHRATAERACRALLLELADAPIAELCARVSDRGSVEPANFDMRDACYYFALLHRLTGERPPAEHAAALLSRFAASIPKWPVWNPYHTGTEHEKTPFAQDDPKAFESQYSAGLWGHWIYFDLLLAEPLLRAHDSVRGSGVLEEREARKVEAMLRRHLHCQRLYNPLPDFSNMDTAAITGLFFYGQLMNEPEIVHEAIHRYRALFKTSFYSDGWWHEGSTSYHADLVRGLEHFAREWVTDYNDPPGFRSRREGKRLDRFHLLEDSRRPLARALRVLDDLRQPHGLLQAIGDSQFPVRAHGTPLAEAKPRLFGAVGHALLATGKGEHMAQATLHFGGSHGHSHHDTLAITYFAKGRELISETQYHPQEATNSTREWHTSTAAHATVVVDETNQKGYGPLGDFSRSRQPEDAIEGIPDWRWRWRGHGNRMDDGRLRLFQTDFEDVQVVEADGERVYAALLPVERYQRTLALVKVDERDTYLVDIFRVRGGRTHDYMLHGCLDEPHRLETSVPLGEPRQGGFHHYLTALRAGRAAGAWNATFLLDAAPTTGLRTWFADGQATEVLCGTGPAMRRPGTAPFLVARRAGDDHVFAAIHHGFHERPRIVKVEAVPLEGETSDAVAIRVTLPERVDTVVSCMEAGTRARAADGSLDLSCRFAHFAEGQWRYTVGERPPHEGVVTRTHRREAGDPLDAFETETPLPDDGSLDGHTLVLDLGSCLTQGFRIERVECRGGRSLIHLSDEPGITVTPGLVKMEYYPGWGIRGEARFRIASTSRTIYKASPISPSAPAGP
ncbi:MAG: heparinase II/III family protein [Verrucomicrobiae bacterium]|nr:heparinase II/III family protein [Verrucomicrobiae bacterium]